jgi:hypothetical protein
MPFDVKDWKLSQGEFEIRNPAHSFNANDIITGVGSPQPLGTVATYTCPSGRMAFLLSVCLEAWYNQVIGVVGEVFLAIVTKSCSYELREYTNAVNVVARREYTAGSLVQAGETIKNMWSLGGSGSKFWDGAADALIVEFDA